MAERQPIPDFSAGLAALTLVQAVFPKAVLAGGYLRDLFFGKTPKDIDIFVPYTEFLPNNTLGLVAMTGAADYTEQSEIDSIYDMQGFELPVQVIMRRRGLDPVE